MNLTTKLKHINYALKRQQNSAPSQGAVTETIFTLLPKITTTKRKKEKWTEKEEKKNHQQFSRGWTSGSKGQQS